MSEVKRYTTNDIIGAIKQAAQEDEVELFTGHHKDGFLKMQIGNATQHAKKISGEEWTINREGNGGSFELKYPEDHIAGILDELSQMTRSSRNNGLRRAGVTPQMVRRAEEILFQPQENTEI